MTGLTASAARVGRIARDTRATVPGPGCLPATISATRVRSIQQIAAAAVALMLPAVPVSAQSSAAVPQGSLVIDPQQGATPRPLQPSPPLPPTRTEAPVPVPVPTAPTIGITALPPILPRGAPVAESASPTRPGSRARTIPGGLPAPTQDPLRIDPTTDPILQLARAQSSMATFQSVIRQAVTTNPSLDESLAQAEEAEGVRGEAKARRLPTADLSISTFQVISRAFSNDPGNVLERSRPSHRTDGLARIQVPVVDFGAGLSRVRASQARLDAARAGIDDTGTQIALRAVSAWYTVYGYRVLVTLGEAFATSQRGLRANIEERVTQGAAALGDVAQVDSYIASSDSQLADFRRQLASAEAQYTATIGTAPPATLLRAPVPSLDGIAATTLTADTDALPAVRAARLNLAATQADVRALKSDRLPQLSAGIDAGRYGVIETARDYDIRGSLTLSLRLGGGAAQRVDQAKARANGADARLRRTRVEAQRDAEIALSDVKALEDAQAAIETNYIASRRSRDVLAERFRVSRGTLFDLLGAESNYFGVAARYVQTVIELDTARYALLARTGRLLPLVGLDPSTLDRR